MSDYSQTRSFNFGIAQDTSVEAALVYDGFTYMNDNHADDDGWFYQSYETLQRLLPFSKSTIRRAIDQLIEKNFIEKSVFKVNGAPTCHYRISESFSLVLSDSVNLEHSMDSFKLKHSNNKTKQLIQTTKNDLTNSLLSSLISLVNPNEKPTAERGRALRARLKDYTAEEICNAAIALSKSEWHKANKQMSIDNLLAPSKFGRWYAAGLAERPNTLEDIAKEQDERVRRRAAE